MQKAADAVAEARQDPLTGVKGIHFEGPHISIEKRGVHKADFIRPLSDDELGIYQRDDIGVKLLTIAPETVTTKQIETLVEQDCIVSIGHTNADYETCLQAIKAGARCFTHLYNAMSGMQGRQPGAIGAALTTDVYYGLIMDGYHVHPAMTRIAYQQNTNLILVTDAMPIIGTERSHFEWYGQSVQLVDGRLIDNEGRLAGAALTQNQALANAMLQLELSIEDALPMATTAPANLVGLTPELARIEAGAVADLVLLDETAEVGTVWRAGNEVFSANNQS
jgi:N-acetylglucosamine-6-phosphate deacetylase